MRIFVNGGLGNQLFQFSFAHSKNGNIKVYLDSNSRIDRPFELSELVTYCKHNAAIGNKNEVLFRLRIKLSRIPLKLNLKFLSIFFNWVNQIDIESDPFTFNANLKRIRSTNVHLGYFQHWKYVENNWSLFGSELFSFLENVNLPNSISRNLQNTILIHIRQGDLINVKDTMGILDADYYKNSISLIKKKNPKTTFDTVFVTDDVSRAKEVARLINLENFIIYGPEDLSAWQTLKLLSIAKFIVSANSTLSWWGAFISYKLGGFVVFPKPWFKNWHENVGNAFYFPGSNTEKSYFMK